MRGIAAGIAAAAFFAGRALADVDPIVIKGSKFFYKTNGTQFFLQGVAYQRTRLPSLSPATNAYYSQRTTAQTPPPHQQTPSIQTLSPTRHDARRIFLS
jgi:hypothetical protein